MDAPLLQHQVVRASSPVVVDGDLSDAAWKSSNAISLLLQDGSGEPRLKTIARLCYDDTCLYVAFECADTTIAATMTQRDDPIYDEEVVEIFLDPDCDELTYCEFEVNPLNTVFDALVFNPTGKKGEIDTSWDCAGLRTAVIVSDDESMWTVEMAIPFASLPGALHTPPLPGDTWRANLYRIERSPDEEYTCWSPTLAVPANYHVPSKFGTLLFG